MLTREAVQAVPQQRAMGQLPTITEDGKTETRRKDHHRCSDRLIVLVLGFAAAVYGYIQHNFGKMNGQNNFDIADVRNENISLEMRDKMEKGYWTIAVFGLDSRDNSTGKQPVRCYHDRELKS